MTFIFPLESIFVSEKGVSPNHVPTAHIPCLIRSARRLDLWIGETGMAMNLNAYKIMEKWPSKMSKKINRSDFQIGCPQVLLTDIACRAQLSFAPANPQFAVLLVSADLSPTLQDGLFDRTEAVC